MSVLSSLARYRQSLKGAVHLETTQLQLINLDELKARYRGRWPNVRARIFDTCEQFIKKRIGPDDLVLRADSGFVVLPGPARRETAAEFAARIEIELKAFFLGTDYLNELEVCADTVNLAVADLFGHAETADPDASVPRENGVTGLAAPGPLTFSRFSLGFEPFWALATGFVALHRARAWGQMDATGPLVSDHRLCPGAGGGALRLAFDQAVLNRVASALVARPVSCVVAVPVHFETLAIVKHRLPYMAAVNEIGESLRARLMLNIAGMPMDAPAGLITEVTRFARILTRRTMVQVDLATLRLDRFDDAVVDIVSISAPAADAFQRHHAEMDRLSERLFRSGRMLAIEGCDSRDQLANALQVQSAYLGGRAVGAEARLLPAPYRMVLKMPARTRREAEPCRGLPS